MHTEVEIWTNQPSLSYNYKALTTFHHDASNSHVPGLNFLEFLVISPSTRSHSESTKNTCMYKSYCVCSKSFRLSPLIPKYLIWLLITFESKMLENVRKCITFCYLKSLEVTLLLTSAVSIGCLIQNKDLLEIYSFLSNNCQNVGNMRTATEITSPCIKALHCLPKNFFQLGGILMMFLV